MIPLKSSTRLFLLVGVLSGLLLTIGSMGLLGIRQSSDALKTIYVDRTVAIGLLGAVQHQLLRSRLLIDASVMNPTPQVIAENLAELSNTSAVINTIWVSYMATYLTQEEAVLAAKFEQDHAYFDREGLLPAVSALRANDIDSVQGLIQEKIHHLDDQLQFVLERLMQIQLDVARQEYQQAVERYLKLQQVTWAAIGGGVLFALLTSRALLRARRQELVVLLERQAHADMTRQQQELAENEFRWKSAIEGVGDGVWDRNIQTGEEMYSTRWKSMLGYAEDDIFPNNQEWESRIHPDDRAAVLAGDQAYLAGTSNTCQIEFRLRCKDGSYRWILSRGVVVARDASGAPLRMIGTHTDIMERKKQEETLRLAANVFRHAIEGIMITTMEGRIVEVNQAFTLITGYSRDEVLGHTPRMLSSGRHESQFYDNMWRELSENGSWVGENWNRRKNGDLYVQLQKISTTHDENGNAQYYVSLFSDITLAKDNEQKLEHLARYDSLTQLPNRALLTEHINQALKQTQRRGQHLAVVFIDLDGFKAVNDNHGHEAGDHLLVTLAERMKGTLRTGDMLARLGGDEFVAVLLDLADADASAPMLNRLLGAVSQPVEYAQAQLQVSASMGVSFYPQPGELAIEQLLRQADQAMYQAKQAGKNRFHVFDAEQDQRVRSRYESVRELECALRAGEFVLEYQPKVNLRTRTVIGVEALVRWQHPQRGLLRPAEFLPLIEDHPLAIELGQWVIENALLQIERWQQNGVNIAVSINIGRRHLRHPGFVQDLRDTLAEHPKLKPGCLELEIQEGCATDDPTQVVQIVRELRAIGIDCTLDNFGSGHSSLTALKKMPLKYLKFDAGFIRDMLSSSDSLLILIAALKMASAYEMKVIAAGMETAAHGFMLTELGCDLAQGYGIAHPMPAVDLPGWIKCWKPVPDWLNVTLVPGQILK